MTLSCWAKALAISEFRDKFGRMAQFSARMGMGILAEQGEESKELLGKVTALQNTLRDGRHMGRWLKWVAMVPFLQKNLATATDNAKNLTAYLAKLAMALFMFFDNIRWLQKLKLVPGENSFKSWHPIHGNGKFALSFLALGSFFSMLNQLVTYTKTEDKEENQAAKSTALKQAFKWALMTYQGLHLSQLYVSENKWVGLAGLISSAMDSQTQWNAANKK